MKARYIVSLAIGCLLFAFQNSNASHIQGALLSYSCLPGCTIQVELRMYRDCSGITNMPPFNIYFDTLPGCPTPLAVGNPTPATVVEFTPICASFQSQCTQPGAQINGVTEYYTSRPFSYCGNPANCDFDITWSYCCRSGAITSGAGNTSIWLATHFDAGLGVCNNAPVFNRHHNPYICQGQVTEMTLGAIDPNGVTTFVNPACRQVTGYESRELIGHNWWDMLSSDKQRQQVEQLLDALSSGDVRDNEMVLTHKNGHPRTVVWNSVNRYDEDHNLIEIIGFGNDITVRKHEEKEREKLIEELQNALAEIKTLSGLLPICSNCKKIRDDKGYWNQIEAYISIHSGAEFSHGICPECAQKLYPNLIIYPE